MTNGAARTAVTGHRSAADMDDGLRKFWCKGCVRSFNALTVTPLAQMHKKKCWLDFGGTMSEGVTVDVTVERCDLRSEHCISLAPWLSHLPDD